MRSLTGRPLFLLLLTLLLAGCVTGAILARWSSSDPALIVLLVTLVIAAALVAAWLPFRTLDHRFTGIAETAGSIAAGDLSRRIPIEAHDDLARLARSLNDIAERFESKLRELQAERDGSRAILGNIPIGLALIGRDLSVRQSNGRFWEMLALDRPPGDARLAAARQPVLEEMTLAALGQRHAVVREVILYLDERREYEIRASPIGAYAGADPEAILISLEDLRPERALTAMRREFVANASHELKTPLTSIRGYAETLLSGGLEDAENRARFVQTIDVQASRLEALVEDLLELADLERADAPLELKDWDLGEIVRDLAETFQDVASRQGLRLILETRSGITLRLDRARFELALRNLLDNAVKYTERGTVLVRTEERGDLVRVSVTDTGRGIEAEHLPRLFERFYRVDRSRSRAVGGTGLGLSIVKHAVQLLGGHVAVDSAPGRGTTFCIELPRGGTGRGAPRDPA